jgi:hypothetical protein
VPKRCSDAALQSLARLRRPIDAGSLPGGPAQTSVRRERTFPDVRRDASEAHIWARFVSPRTARSLCVAPLEQAPDAFPVTADENGRSAFVCVAPLEMP